MSNWKPVGVVAEGEPIWVDGMNLWAKHWKKLDQPSVQLRHPSHSSQMHRLSVFQAEER
jgi:hypothetical protein